MANGAIHLRRILSSNQKHDYITIVIVIFLSLFINHLSFEFNLCVQVLLAGFEGSLVVIIFNLKSKVQKCCFAEFVQIDLNSYVWTFRKDTASFEHWLEAAPSFSCKMVK